jgi:septum formation protein
MDLSWPIVLASASPRRQDLLRKVVPVFDVDPADVDETPEPGESPRDTAMRLAVAKLEVVKARRSDCLVIAGDTVVAFPMGENWVQLGKPCDPGDAARMLALLSGRTHVVITGMAIASPDRSLTFAESTEVRFRQLSDEEIKRYVATGEPLDKAGAYAIQGGARPFVDSIEGSLSNVIGLPLEALERELRHLVAET